MEFFYASDFPSVFLRHYSIVFLFPMLPLCFLMPSFVYMKSPEFLDFFFVSGVLKFHDYEFWYQAFIIYLYWLLEKPSSYGNLHTSLRVHSWCYFFDDFLLTSFPVLSLLNFYNQKLDFLNKLPKIFHFISSTVIYLFSLFDLWEFSSTVSSNHSTAFCFHFRDHNLQEFFTIIWMSFKITYFWRSHLFFDVFFCLYTIFHFLHVGSTLSSLSSFLLPFLSLMLEVFPKCLMISDSLVVRVFLPWDLEAVFMCVHVSKSVSDDQWASLLGNFYSSTGECPKLLTFTDSLLSMVGFSQRGILPGLPAFLEFS